MHSICTKHVVQYVTVAYLQRTAYQGHHIAVHDQCSIQGAKHCSQIPCRSIDTISPAYNLLQGHSANVGNRALRDTHGPVVVMPHCMIHATGHAMNVCSTTLWEVPAVNGSRCAENM